MSETDYAVIPDTVLMHFDLSSSPYDEVRVQCIKDRRQAFPDGRLFIDQLLQLAEIDGPALYPPTSPAGHRRLLASIHSSDLDRLKQDCLYYYLLRDYERQSTGRDGDRLDGFAKARCFSKTWRVFMDGYWNLDNGNWETAITNLTNPAITEVNFPSAIIHTLATLAEPPSLALSLIHTFLLTRLPSAETHLVDVEIYTSALASALSISSAFSYIRSVAEPDRQTRLREVVWSWALGSPQAPCGAGKHVVQHRAIKEILHHPLLAEEDDHLLRFLLHPPRSITPQALSLLHDLVTLRLIHQGKYAESLQLDKELAGSGGKEDDRQRRREMVREFIAILPEAQRRALAVDSEVKAERREKELVNGVMEVDTVVGTVDLSADNGDDVMAIDSNTAAPAFPLKQPVPSHRLPPSALSLSQSINRRPGSPVPNTTPRVVSTHSPFSGPPRFATHPNLNPTMPSSPRPNANGNANGAGPIQRVLSGSPFTLPMSKGANAVRSASFSRTPTNQAKPLPIPRPKSRPEACDDDEQDLPERRRPKQIGQISRQRSPDVGDHAGGETEVSTVEVEDGAGDGIPVHDDRPTPIGEQEIEPAPEHNLQPAPEPEHEPEPEPEPTPRTRRSKRTTTVSPAAPVAPGPAPARRSSRQTKTPTPGPTSPTHHRIPGTFEPVPEDRPLQTMSRSRTRRQLSVTPAPEQEPSGRTRITRSASRATLGDPDEGPAAKRSRRLSVASEMDETASATAPTPEASKRRTTRRAKNESERGSPTPSVATSVGGRSRRAASQTPRKSTRTRK